MKRLLMMMVMVALAAPAAAETVEVGKADWSSFPPLKAKRRDVPNLNMVNRVQEMLREKECSFEGQSAESFDITVPYAVLVGPDGKAERVVVQDTGCKPLESAVGGLVLERSRLGDFQKSAGTAPKWYADQISFNFVY